MKIEEMKILENNCSSEKIVMDSYFLCLESFYEGDVAYNWRWSRNIMLLRDYILYIFVPVFILQQNKESAKCIRDDKIAGFTLDDSVEDLNEFEKQYKDFFDSITQLTDFESINEELEMLFEYLDQLEYSMSACIINDIHIAKKVAAGIELQCITHGKSFAKKLEKIIEMNEGI